MRPTSRCRSCDAAIFWALGSRGGKMPIDAEPREDGNLWINNRDRALPVTPDTPATELRFVSHFATCPNASSHRRRT